MSWLLIALGAVVSVATKPKPYQPSADYIRITKALEDEWKRLNEPRLINLREILPTDYTTEKERLQAIKAWNDYYQKRDRDGLIPELYTQMYIDGYSDVVKKLGIESSKYYHWIK